MPTGPLSALAEGSSPLIFAADGSGFLVYCTPPLETFTGKSRALLSREGWADVVVPEDRLLARTAWREGTLAGASFTLKTRIRSRGGGAVGAQLHVLPLKGDGPDDLWIAVLSAPADEAERGDGRTATPGLTWGATAPAASAPAAAEPEQGWLDPSRELDHARARLVKEIKRRESVQAALLESRKLEALGQLTSIVAHDFNNVLAAVIGGFSLIRSRSDAPKIRALAGEGIKAAERGAGLIGKLLAFARRRTNVAQSVEVKALLDEVAPQLRHLVGADVRLTIDDAERMPAIDVDPAQLQAAITNIVVNARDATGRGGQVHIRFETAPAGGPQAPKELLGQAGVAIHVTDDGPGMAPAVLQRVLEPFYTTKEPGQGTGLGLAMVHALVLQAGGALRIKSVVGQGTTISLYFPASSRPQDADAVEETHSAVRHHRGGRVLLAEDDDLVREVVRGQLSDWGYDVVEAINAAEAQAILQDGGPLVAVIADHGLTADLRPAARAIRPGAPMLVMTGQPDPGALDGERLLLKPFSAEALSTAVLDAVDERQAIQDKEATLDRLSVRLKSPDLLEALAIWRRAVERSSLPRLDQVKIPPSVADKVAHVLVDQTCVPMTFDLVRVGSSLRRGLGTTSLEARLAVTGETDEISQEGAYRRCVRSRKPTYEYARFNLGDAEPWAFERLLLPCSDDGLTVTAMIAVVNLADARPKDTTLQSATCESGAPR